MSAAETATRNAVEPGKSSKQTLAWERYIRYIKSISIDSDPFLDGFTKFQRIKFLGAFAHAIRDGRLHHHRANCIKSESCRATIDCVAQTFRMTNRPDPRLDDSKLL
jgi:hypothetical protein